MRKGYRSRRCLRLLTRFIKEYQTDNLFHREVIDSLRVVHGDLLSGYNFIAYTFIAGPACTLKDHKYFYAQIYIDLYMLRMMRFEVTRIYVIRTEAQETIKELLRVVDREIASGEVIPKISPVMKQDIKYLGIFRIGEKK